MKSKLLNIVILFLLPVGGNVFADNFNYSIRVVNNTDTVITAQPFDNMGVPVCEPENVILSTHNSSKTCDADPTFSGVVRRVTSLKIILYKFTTNVQF